MANAKPQTPERTTHVVSPEVFQQVYDSPASLPGAYRWVTRDEDVRAIEKILGIHSHGTPPATGSHNTSSICLMFSSNTVEKGSESRPGPHQRVG